MDGSALLAGCLQCGSAVSLGTFVHSLNAELKLEKVLDLEQVIFRSLAGTKKY